MALVEDPELKKFSGYVQDSGEGRWTVNAAIEEAVPAEVLRLLCTRDSDRVRTTRLAKKFALSNAQQIWRSRGANAGPS